jgi:DNA-binding transcriptional ArsR family regulator
MEAEPQVMDALGHPIRRQILVLLKERPRPVGELADNFSVSRPAISKHLRVLKGAGLVAFRPQGTRNIFRLHPEGFAAARDFLDSFWEQALENFQQLVQEEIQDEENV